MVTRYNPRLLVRLGGQLVAQGGADALVAVDKMAVTWGRQRVWDHQDVGQAKLSLWDKRGTYASHISGNWLMNMTLQLSYDVPGVIAERVFFRGKVTTADMAVLTPDRRTGDRRGVRLDITADSLVAFIGNVKTGVVNRPTEAFLTRWTWLRSFVVPSIITLAAYDSSSTEQWGATQLAARSYNNESVLAALRTMLDFTGDRQAYDPQSNALGYVGRRMYDLANGYGVLSADATNASGLVLKSPSDPGLVSLDAGEFAPATNQLTRSTEGAVTAVTVTRWTDATGATPTQAILYTDAVADVTAPQRMDVATDFYSTTDQVNSLTKWTGILQREGKRWRPPLLTHQTKALGGLTAGQLVPLLGGAETGYFYLSRSAWSAVGVAPVWGIIGGAIEYDGGDPVGWWKPSVQLASVYARQAELNGYTPRTPANCDTGAAVRLKPSQLAASVSAADAAFWTAPYTG